MTDIRPIQIHVIKQPGWPEIVIAVGVYVLGISLVGYWMLQQPDEQAAFRINIAFLFIFSFWF